MKTYEWELTDGRKVTLQAWYEATLDDNIVDADGFKVNLGVEVKEKGNLVAYIDGKEHDSCWNTAFWQIIDVPNRKDIKKIWGIKGIGFTEERAVEIEYFLKDVINSGRTVEVKKHLAEEDAKKRAARIEDLEKCLKQAAKNTIYTPEEATRMRKAYIECMNEGGEGYVPHFYTTDEVESWGKELSELRAFDS